MGAVGSHMLLQRERPLPIWGWANAGEEVPVKLDGATAKDIVVAGARFLLMGLP